jgi:hypothetical protein
MMTERTKNDNAPTNPITENSLVFRNDILLPKSLFSGIVVSEKGLRVCPEVPLFTGTYLAKHVTPLLNRLHGPNVKNKVI